MNERITDAEIGTPSFGALKNSEKKPYFAHNAEKWALPAAWLLGWLYCKLVVFPNGQWYAPRWMAGQGGWNLNLGPLVFALLFAGAVLALVLGKKERVFTMEPILWLVCLLAVACGIAFDRGNVVGESGVWLLLHGYAVWWTISATGGLTDGKTGGFFLCDLFAGLGRAFAGLVYWPLGGIHLLLDRKNGGEKRLSLASGLYLLGALFALILAASWLAGADSGFGARLRTLFAFDDIQLGENVALVILGLPVGAFFYGLGAGKPNRKPSALRLQNAGKLRQVPCGVVCVTLAAFFLLYLLFFGVQGEYLFGAFAGRLPDGFTVAEYARQGFFELCLVMLLNLGLLTCGMVFAQKPVGEHKLLRLSSTALMGFTLLLWSTAAAKLGLYILTFGFTPKRLLAAWALLTLLVAGILSVVNLWKKCPVVRPTLLVGGIGMALLCLV